MCESVSSLFNTHNLCVFLFGRGACTRCPLGGNLHALWAFSIKKLRYCLSLFPRIEGQPSVSRDSGPIIAEAWRRMKSWGSQLDLADELERELSFDMHRPRTRASCWIVMMRSFWHHPIQRLVLCWVMPRKSRRCLRVRKLRLNPLNPPALRMTSYWRLWSVKNQICFWP